MSEMHSFISVHDSFTETEVDMDSAFNFLPLNKDGTLPLEKSVVPSSPSPSYLPHFETPPSDAMALSSNTSHYIEDLKHAIIKTVPWESLELHDPVILIEVSPSVQKYAELLLGLKNPTPDLVRPRLSAESAIYLYALHKYQRSNYHLMHPCHLPILQLLIRYQNPSFSFQSSPPITEPKKIDPNRFFHHERVLFETLALHFKDPTDFIAFFRRFPVVYFGHYLLRAMVAFTRHVRDRGPHPVVLLWDGDNLSMPDTFLNMLDLPWLKVHVHVLVNGQQEWQFIKQLSNCFLHVSHRTFKEAVDYRVLEQIKVSAPFYKDQSLIIVSRDRSFEIMAQLAREKLNTWVYRACKVNEVIFLLHWIELHMTNLHQPSPPNNQ